MKGERIKMKKIVYSSVVALASLVLFSGVALAVESEEEALTSKSIESELSITFKGDETVNPGEGPFANALSFPWAPKEFAFGKQTADFSNNTTYELKNAHVGSQYLVVNDDRDATDARVGKGWALKVNMAPITSTDESKRVIAGTLGLKLEPLQHYNMGKKMNEANTDYDPANPTDMQLDENGKPTTIPVVQDWEDVEKTAPTDIQFGADQLSSTEEAAISITPNKEVAIMDQTDRTIENLRGKEGYATRLGTSTISFSDVDNTVVGKTFTTVLTWTLARDLSGDLPDNK